jgi:hypothetical protein
MRLDVVYYTERRAAPSHLPHTNPLHEAVTIQNIVALQQLLRKIETGRFMIEQSVLASRVHHDRC